MTGPDDTPIAAELIDMAGARFEVVARMGSGDADAVVFRTRMAAGRTVPLHSHVDPECFYVLSGQIDVFVLDEAPRWHKVMAGRSLIVTDGVKHAVRNAGDVAADMVLTTNNRLARYFREAGRPATPGSEPVPLTPEDLGRMVRVAKEYGYWLASPAESEAVLSGHR